jgi:integrase
LSALLTENQWTAKMRVERAVKDKSYRRFPIGQEVGRFLRAKRIEGCAENTLKSYETTLCRFTLDHRDLDSLSPFSESGGDELIVDFLAERWGDAAPATLDNRIGALKSFFAWAEETGRIFKSPRIKRRRVRGEPVREAHELSEIHFIVSAQVTIEDEAAILLAGRLGFRKMDVGNFQARDVDLSGDRVFVRKGKGDQPVELPIAFDDLRDSLKLWLATVSDAKQYLWHPRGHKTRPPNPATVHRRFKRCLERAEVEDFPMHELRHSAGDRLWRTTGDFFAANQLLRHKSLEWTRRYLHPTQDDLRARLKDSEK